MRLVFTVDGVSFDMPDELTFREMRVFKNASGGIPAGQLHEALSNGDSDAIVAICVIGLDRHHGHEPGTTSVDYLLSLKESQIQCEFITEPDDEKQKRRAKPKSKSQDGKHLKAVEPDDAD